MVFIEGDPKPSTHYKFYEYNSGELNMAREYKYRSRTKFLNVELHHFRYYVNRREINIHKIITED